MRNPALLALVSLLSFSLWAQSTNGSITGRVTDPSKAVLPAAKVVLTDIDRGATYTVSSDKAGGYLFPNVAPGNYRMEVQKQGFRSVIKPAVIVHLQDALEINFEMSLGAVSESITVTAGAPIINTNDASVSTVVDQAYLKNMPLNGRSFQDLILLTPGVVTQTPQLSAAGITPGVGQTGEFSVNGQRTEENYYTVDGVSANVGATAGANMNQFGGSGGSVAASTALGTTQALVSIDDLQEFRIQSSTYSAEYGRNPGAQIAFETKSGTNQWHGTAYDYFRNDFFDASDYFTNYLRALQPTLTKGALRQNDFGGTFGGPIRIPHLYDGKDKTFFFFSYEGLRLIQPQPAAVMPVPDNSLRQSTPSPLNQVLNAFPLPTPGAPDDQANGVAQYIAGWSNPSSIDSTSVRFDHVVKDRTRLFFRFSNTHSDSAALQGLPTGAAAPSVNQTSTYTMRTYTGGASTLISSRLSNEFRVNYSSNVTTSVNAIESVGGNTPVNLIQLAGLAPTAAPEVIFLSGPFFFQQFAGETAGAQRQWNLIDTVSYTLGHHQLKFGADYRRLTPYAVPNDSAFYVFCCDITSIQANSSFAVVNSSVSAYPLITNLSVFAEDEWKATQRLNLSLGLRWEVNPATGVTQGVKPYTVNFQGSGPDTWTLAPAGTPLWKTTWFNFAPRLGAAYTLRNSTGRETVLRGGAGLFFDTAQQLAGLSFSSGPGFGADGLPQQSPFPGNLVVPQVQNPPQPPFRGVVGFAPHLQLPYTIQWNTSIEQALGRSQALSISYVGSHASRLLQQNVYTSATNPILGGSGEFLVVQNGLTSDYNALQIQFHRRLSRGLTALASHTWSHCIDDGSINFNNGYERGNCDFDVRHSFSGALSFDVPNVSHNGIGSIFLHHWGIDGRFIARTAFPVDLLGNQSFDPNTGRRLTNGLNFTGKPIYIYGAQCSAVYAIDFGNTLPCPGGRAINPDAFTAASSGLGNVPRTFARGFDAWQMNVAIRREFPVYENLKLQFRAEAFNVFNHPSFGTINPGFGQNTFGQATATLANSLGVLNPLYQMGGARSLQFALKLVF
jgi:Carboxypeptidase regulatory-like domain/TonB dependent receptor